MGVCCAGLVCVLNTNNTLDEETQRVMFDLIGCRSFGHSTLESKLIYF